MARSHKNMSNKLITLYQNKDDKRKGMYRLSKDAFKTIAGKAALKEAYLWDVNAALREDGFMMLDMKDEYNQIAILSMETVINKFQELAEELIEDNACPSDDDDW